MIDYDNSKFKIIRNLNKFNNPENHPAIKNYGKLLSIDIPDDFVFIRIGLILDIIDSSKNYFVIRIHNRIVIPKDYYGIISNQQEYSDMELTLAIGRKFMDENIFDNHLDSKYSTKILDYLERM